MHSHKSCEQAPDATDRCATFASVVDHYKSLLPAAKASAMNGLKLPLEQLWGGPSERGEG